MSQIFTNLKHNSTFKLLTIIFLILLMLIPLAMVKDLIYERTSMRSSAESKIAQSWGDTQTISGPVLKIPYKARIVEKKYLDNGQEQNIYRYELHHILLLSDKLDIKTKMESETRYLGIYEMPVYLSHSNIEASFGFNDLKKLNDNYENILWDKVQLIYPVSDVRGIRQLEAITDHFETHQSLNFTPYHDNNFLKGISAEFPVNMEYLLKDANDLALSMNLSLAGSRSILFRPFGRKTNISMISDWHSPGFNGKFLPSERTITEAGFSASWQILELNRTFPQQWLDNQFDDNDLRQIQFGVKLYQPANVYQQNKRTIKYAVLFIALTYMTFFLFEIMYKEQLHPLQYFFTGGALSTFYLLLIAFSEHTGFAWAYLIATISISLLLGGYSISLFKSRPRGYLTGFLFLVLYGFFYILIKSEENALLLGSIAFFSALTIIMYSTRNINWYQNQGSSLKTREANS